jgi:hypothetical protein
MTLLTEQEAMTQRCIGPEGCGVMVGIGEPRVIEHNDGYPEDPAETYHEKYWEKYERRCIGSACKMAWRWSDEYRSSSGGTGSYDFMQAAGYPEPYEQLGYCGIAGRPE